MSEFAMDDFAGNGYAANGHLVNRAPFKGGSKRKEREAEFDWRATGAPHAAPTDSWGSALPAEEAVPSRSRRNRAARGIGILVASLGAAILAAAAFLLIPSGLKVSRYDVAGTVGMSREDVLSAALVHGNEYFFALDTGRMERSLLAEPRIAAAKVERVFPNRVKIAVTERVPAALILVESESGLVPVCLDAQSYAFAYAGDYASRLADGAAGGAAGGEGFDADLPVISGLRFEGFRLGARLPLECRASIASIAEIQAKSPVLLKAFSEIKIVKPRFGEPELVLYPVHLRLPVRTGPVLNESTLRSIILVLDILGSRGIESAGLRANGLEEIDFRSGTIVYRAKGGQSD